MAPRRLISGAIGRIRLPARPTVSERWISGLRCTYQLSVLGCIVVHRLFLLHFVRDSRKHLHLDVREYLQPLNPHSNIFVCVQLCMCVYLLGPLLFLPKHIASLYVF